MADFRDFFEQNWAVLQQAELYLPHPNPTFANPDFETAELRVLIVRLSPFRDVDRSIPHLFLYQAVRRARPDAYIDMAFFPPEYDRQCFEAAGIPFLVGGQSFHSAEDFDLVLISNAYTLELLNLPYLLLHSGLPLLSSEREALRPMFILGGSNALAAQALVTEEGDSLVDAIFFGEGEDQIGALIQDLTTGSEGGKGERLAHAASLVTGLWVAQLSTSGRQITKAICQEPHGEELVVTYPMLNSAEATRARLQIAYGCPAFCSFCFEGYERKPYRELTLSEILDAARRLKQTHGSEVLELYSFNFNTHTDIFTLLRELNHLFDRVSFKSQRVDILSVTPELLQAEVAADKRSFTLGIEGISERQRAFLHKSLSESTLLVTLAELFRQKIREIKLFYMLTGYEDEADLVEFRGFLSALKALQQRTNRGIRVIFSFGRLIRMPFTPLRYDRLFLDEADYVRLDGFVKSACEMHGFEFRMATPWDEYCVSQVLALGGYWLHQPLVALAQAGHCYDLSLAPGYWTALRDWLQQHAHWDEAFLGPKGPDYPFAFESVHTSVPPAFLYQQYQKALAGVDEGYCLGNDCQGCGACLTPEQRKRLTTHTIQPPADAGYLNQLQSLMQTKWRLHPTYVKFRLPSQVAGVVPEWLNAWVLRALLARYPELCDNLLSAQEALFTTRENRRQYVNLCGETVFALKAWDAAAMLDLLSRGGGEEASLSYLGVAAGFEPGSFVKMRLTFSLPLRYFPEAGQRLRDFLRDAYVSTNIRRDEAGYCFDLPDKALKKKLLFAGRYVLRGGACDFDLTVGPKFDLVGFLRAFDNPARYRQIRAVVSELDG